MIIHTSLTSKITIKLQPSNSTHINIALNPSIARNHNMVEYQIYID